MARGSDAANNALAGFATSGTVTIKLNTGTTTFEIAPGTIVIGNNEVGDKAEALAKLSEGFCPVCNTRYEDRRGDGQLVCERWVTLDLMRHNIESMPDDQR